ncbi:hypothetical protein [Catenulispora acidiphila]|uniref:hypothetical protein n=1 Tax=Catenulispora acidiphila TaxID=304895 RepID=UPI00019E427A|nr:hypothetical protein [Catenulispora acidiphila]
MISVEDVAWFDDWWFDVGERRSLSDVCSNEHLDPPDVPSESNADSVGFLWRPRGYGEPECERFEFAIMPGDQWVSDDGNLCQ